MSNGSFTENYHGFSISSDREAPRGDYHRWLFRVSHGGKLQFRHSIRISRTQATLMRLDDAKINRTLRDRGLRRVRGKIDLDRYVEGEDEEFVITDDPPAESSLNDRDIRLFILQVLEKIRRLEPNPVRQKLQHFDAQGFCEILGITHADYVANAAYLLERDYVVNTGLEQITIENGGICITAAGIDYLEEQRRKAEEDAVSAEAEHARDQILQILYQHEESGDIHFFLSTAIAEQMGLSDKMVRHHLDVLYRDGYITLSRTFTNWCARLDTRGRQRILEGYRHAPFANVTGPTNISISNSTIGLLNTGAQASFDSITVHVSQLTHAGQEEVAQALAHLTEAVTNDKEMTSEMREEILAQLADLSEQATLEPDQRMKMPTIRAMVNGIVTALTAAGSSAQIWSTWGPTIMRFFGLA